MQQTLFLMLGYPGSGKTTTSKFLHEMTGAEHLWADHERKQRFVQPTYSHTENVELYDRLNDVADRLLAAGKSVIYDTNFNFYKDREKMRAIAAKYGARTIVIWVTAPKALAEERAVRESHGQHTRVFGNMPLEHFERIANNLEPPREGEQVIEVDGRTVTAETVTEIIKQL